MACSLMHSLISESVFEIRWRSELLICTYIAGKSDNLEMIKVLGEGKKFNNSLFWLGKAQLRDFFSFHKPFNSCTALPSLPAALCTELRPTDWRTTHKSLTEPQEPQLRSTASGDSWEGLW